MDPVHPANHPDHSYLHAYLEGRLKEPYATDVAKHLDGCEECVNLLTRWIQEGVGQLSWSAAIGAEASGLLTNPTLQRQLANSVADTDTPQDGERFVEPTLNIQAKKNTQGPAPVVDENTPIGDKQKDTQSEHLALDDDRLVGDYQLHEELGRGGMSVVYRAVDLRLKRAVALKMLLSGSHATPDEMGRFRAEAETIARLRHEGIVQIYEVGEHESRPYLVLELVEGGTLIQFTQRRPQPPRHAAQIVAKLANAIDYAHQQGVIHRDLKPSNVLLAPTPIAERDSSHGSSPRESSGGKRTNEASLDVRQFPKVTDFGLAKQLDALDDRTKTGMVLGTPSYMSPEQAEGDPRAVGTSADIYGLGAILYELLTGRPPFMSDNSLETIRMVHEDDPVPPQKLQPNLPPDFETICLKCLEKEPRKRYATAQELSDDLHRYLKGESIVARPAGVIERTIKWTRRHPSWAVLILVTVVGILGMIGAWRQAVASKNEAVNQAQIAHDARGVANEQREIAERRHLEAVQEHKEAQRQRHRAERQREQVQRRLVTSHLTRWNQSLENGDAFRALGWLRQAWDVEQTLLTKGSPEYKRRERLFRARGTMVLENSPRLVGHWHAKRGHPDAHFSPNGRWLFLGSQDGPARVWDVTTGKQVGSVFDHDKSGVVLGVWSSDGQYLATAGRDGSVKLWDFTTGKTDVLLEPGNRRIYSLVFDPKGLRLAIPFNSRGNRRAECKLFDVCTKKVVANWEEREHPLTCTFSPNGKYAIGVHFWDAQTGKRHHGPPELIQVSRDGSRGLAKTRRKDTIAVVDTSLARSIGKITYEFSRGKPRIHRSAFHAEGRLVALCSTSGEVQIFRIGQPVPVATVQHKGVVHQLAFSPCARYIATGGEDRTVRVWHVRTGKLATSPLPQESGVVSLEFHPEGQLLLTRTDKGTVRVWEFPTLSEREPLPQKGVRLAKLSPTGKRLVTVGECSQIFLWDAETSKLIGKTNYPTDIKQIRFCLDGSRFLVRTLDGINHVHDAKTGRVLAHVGQNLQASGAKLSADGAQVLYRRWLQFNLYDIATKRDLRITRVVGEDGFSPDGQYLVAGQNGHWNVWDPKTGNLLTRLPTKDNANSKKIVIGRELILLTDENNLAQVRRVGGGWDVLAEFEIPPSYQILLSPNEETALVRAYDGTLREYETKTGKLAAPILRSTHSIRSVAYSPRCPSDPEGGRWILTGSEDGCVRLLNANDLVLAGPPWRQGSPIVHVEFHPNGREIVSVSKDGQLRIWAIPKVWLQTNDLAKLADLFPVKISDDPVEPEPLSPTIWDDFRRKYPRYLKAAPERQHQWLAKELHAATMQGDQPAEAFRVRNLILRYEQVVAELKAPDPRNVEVKKLAGLYTRRGLILHQMGERRKALEAYSRAAELLPDWPEPRVLRGWSLACLGKHDEALQAYKDVSRRVAREHITLRLLRSLTYAEKGDFKKADEMYCKVAKMVGWSTEVNEGRIPFGSRIVRQRVSLLLVHRLCEVELQRRPKAWWLWRAQGLALAFVGRSEQAAASWDQALSLKPRDLPTAYNLARLLQRTKRIPEAIGVCRETQKVYPKDMDLWRMRLGIWRRSRLTRHATRKDYAAAIKAGVDDPKTHLEYAHVLMRLNRWELAADHLKKSIRPPKLRLEQVHLHALVTLRAGKMQDHQQVCGLLLHGGKKNPVVARVALRAVALNPKGKQDWDDLLKMAQSHPTPVPGLEPLAVKAALLLRAGQAEEAEKLLHKSVSKPETASPQNYLLLALACHRLGNMKEATKWAEAGRQEYQKQARRLGRLPWILHLEFELLDREFRRLAETSPTKPTHRVRDL